jgi:hypothetical protein
MGFGYRRSIKLAPGLRLNLGRRSAGLGAGPRGAKVSVNTRGQRRASLSWRGFFWRRSL